MECEMIVPDLVARPLAEAVLMARGGTFGDACEG